MTKVIQPERRNIKSTMKTNILSHSVSKSGQCSLFFAVLFGFMGLLALPAVGQGVSSLNPLQVALLKWAPNLTTTFAVVNSPAGLAFDGASNGVVNNGDETVTKLRDSDGAIEGTFQLGSNSAGIASRKATQSRSIDGTFDTGPTTLAYDGANMWIVTGSSNNVT